MVRLGDIIQQIRGVSYSPEDIRAERDENAVALLRANNIRDGALNFEDLIFVDKSRVSAGQYLRKGDILICSSSGSRELVGKAAYVPEDIPAAFGAFCKVARPLRGNARYIGYFFQSASYRRRVFESAAGANINNIRNEHIDNLEMPFPPEETQAYAADVLDKIQGLLASRKRQLAKLDELVKARFAEMFGDPVANEKEWPLVSLGDVAEIRIGPFGSLLHKEDYIEGGHALVNPSHIVEDKIVIDEKLTVSDGKYELLSAYQLEKGDIVLGRRGEMGRCAVVNQNGLLCGTGSMIIRQNGKILPFFLQKMLSNPSYRKVIESKAVGITMMNLNVPIVSSLMLPLLPKELQGRYTAFAEQVGKAKSAVQRGADKLETLKAASIRKYFG